MPAPEKIHITINAADGYGRFTELGIPAQIGDELSPEQITAMLAHQRGRLFRLLGWVAGAESVVLGINGATEAGLQMTNHTRPYFEATYIVAAEPPPVITQPHGDYIFDLTKVEE